MSKNKLSGFDDWFKQQFGGLPNSQNRLKLRNEIDDLQNKLRNKQSELENEIKLQFEYRSAHYAKNKYE